MVEGRILGPAIRSWSTAADAVYRIINDLVRRHFITAELSHFFIRQIRLQPFHLQLLRTKQGRPERIVAAVVDLPHDAITPPGVQADHTATLPRLRHRRVLAPERMEPALPEQQ